MKLVLSVSLLILGFSFAALAQDESEIDVEPTPLPAASTVRARVYYEANGRPVRRTSVILLGSRNNGRESTGLTDANGYLTIKNVKAGKYFAIVNAPGAVSPLAFADLRRNRGDDPFDQLFGEFATIQVDGITDLQIEIPVKTGGSIGGRVTYADGSPAIGVKVEVLRKSGDSLVPVVANLSTIVRSMSDAAGMFMTDDRGMYRFPGLPPGDYLVKVSESAKHADNSERSYGFESAMFGGSSLINVFFQNAVTEAEAQAIRIEMGQEMPEVNIVIPERALHVLEGKLVAAKDKLPIRSASIKLSRIGDEEIETPEYGPNSRALTSTSDNQGVWRFTDLPRGKYKVSITVPNSDFSAEDKAYGSKQYDANAVDAAMAAANRAIANAAYAANMAANAAASGYYGPKRPEKPPEPKFAPKTVEFEIESEDLKDKVIEIDHGSRITGVIEVEKGGELPETATIQAFDPNTGHSVQTSIYSYDYSEGQRKNLTSKEFAIEGVPAGSVELVVSVRDEFFVKTMTAGSTDLMSSSLSTRASGSVSNVKIVLSKETGTLELAVLGANGQPITGQTFTVVPIDQNRRKNASNHRSGRTDDNGRLTVSLQPMEYGVLATPARISPANRRDFQTWLNEAIKTAPKFTVEAGKTVKGSIDGSIRPK